MKRIDVFLESGVTVEVPDDTDVNSDAGQAAVKTLAAAKLIARLNTGDFEILATPLDEDFEWIVPFPERGSTLEGDPEFE